MPKFSIYIPDELWEKALATAPDTKPSTLVQAALRRMIASQGPRLSLANFSDAMLEERRKVLAKVAAKAREAYLSGYQVGLRVMADDELSWQAIEDFERLGWDFEAWKNEFSGWYGQNWGEWWDGYGQEVETGITDSGIQAEQGPTGAVLEGLIDAFKDLRAAALAGLRGEASDHRASPSETPDAAQAQAQVEVEAAPAEADAPDTETTESIAEALP
jgi:hypothetical protein